MLSHRLCALLIILLLLCGRGYAQTPASTAISDKTAPPAASVQSSPNPSPTASVTPDAQASTTVRISTSELELIGFPTWIIWVLIGLAVFGVVLWILMRRGVLFKSEERKSKITVAGVLSLILFLVAVFLIGDWWGRRGAKGEVQAQGAIAVPAPQPTQTAQPAAAVQTNQTPQATPGGSWPFYMVVMAFALLLGLEVAVFMYIYLHWGRDRHHRWRNEELMNQNTALRQHLDQLRGH